MTNKVSIIIVAYINIEDIKNCIESIEKYNDVGDALEIIVGIQELFTIKLDTDKNPEVFKSVSTLADYVMANASVE